MTAAPRIGLGPWLVVGLSFLTLALAFSGRSAVGLALTEWERGLGWPRAEISGGVALALIVMAMVSPVVGNLVDRHGSRWPMALGLLCVAGAMAAVGAMSERWMFYLGFAVLGAVGFGAAAMHSVSAAVAQVFAARRGLATGIATAGASAGQLVVIPALALVMQQASWRTGFFVLAGAAAAAAVAVVAAFPRGAGPSRSPSEAAAPLGERLARLWRAPVFHLLFWSFLICGFTTSGVIETHLIPYAQACGYPPLESATAYGILSAVNLAGMVLAGWLSDRVNRPLLLAAIYFGRALAFVLLLFIVRDIALLFVFAVAFGLFDYATVPVTAALAARHLGVGTLGLAMGVIAAGHQIGGALGAFLGGYLFDAFAKYDGVWFASIAIAAVAGFLALAIRPAGQDRGRPAPALSAA